MRRESITTPGRADGGGSPGRIGTGYLTAVHTKAEGSGAHGPGEALAVLATDAWIHIEIPRALEGSTSRQHIAAIAPMLSEHLSGREGHRTAADGAQAGTQAPRRRLGELWPPMKGDTFSMIRVFSVGTWLTQALKHEKNEEVSPPTGSCGHSARMTRKTRRGPEGQYRLD